MMVQLSITSYGYHLLTQDKVDNGMSGITDVNKTESVKSSRPSRPAEKKESQRVRASRQRTEKGVTTNKKSAKHFSAFYSPKQGMKRTVHK